LDPIPPAYDPDAWTKLVKDQQTKVQTGAILASLPRELTDLLQDLIQSILNVIGYSPGSPQPEQVRQGMVCFYTTLLLLSRLHYHFVEYSPQRFARNGQEDSCSCDLQYAQAPDA
jgi:hypothetical protein